MREYKKVCPMCLKGFKTRDVEREHCSLSCANVKKNILQEVAHMNIIDRKRVKAVEKLIELGYFFNRDGMQWEKVNKTFRPPPPNTSSENWKNAYSDMYTWVSSQTPRSDIILVYDRLKFYMSKWGLQF